MVTSLDDTFASVSERWKALPRWVHVVIQAVIAVAAWLLVAWAYPLEEVIPRYAEF